MTCSLLCFINVGVRSCQVVAAFVLSWRHYLFIIFLEDSWYLWAVRYKGPEVRPSAIESNFLFFFSVCKLFLVYRYSTNSALS